ncbi:WD repeat-containing protein 48 [Linum perenne]
MQVVNYVLEKMVLDKPLDNMNPEGVFASGLGGGKFQNSACVDGSFHSVPKPLVKSRNAIEILCNNQVLSPEMSLATVRTYIWKKPEDVILHYRIVQGK